MLSATMGVSVRVGSSALDGARNSTVGLNLRFIL